MSGYGVTVNFSSGYVADMDNDGDNDIVAANSGNGAASGNWTNTGGIGWYENDGEADPSFTRNNIIDYAYGANNVVVADLNGDRNLDIVSTWVAYPNNCCNANSRKAVYKHINDGNANPSFTSLAIKTGMPNLTSVFAADMDGDGDADVVTSQRNNDSSLSLFKNSGVGGFTYSNIPTNSEVRDFRNVYPGDFNGDGHMDFVVSLNPSSYESYDIQLFENDGNSNPTWTYSTIATSSSHNLKLFVEDIDGDGDADVLSVDNTEPVSWYENGPNYSYTWDVDSGSTPADGTYRVTVAGTASATGGAYSGTDSITFTLDTTAPTVTLTDTDSDNLVSTSEVVTITAGFSEVMTTTPTISITGIVTNVIMTPVSGTNSYTYRWDTSSGTLSDGTYAATVSGTDLIGNAYVAGTQSITFTVDSSTPTVTITTDDPDNSIRPGDDITVTVTFNEPMASGPRITIGSAVNNVALTATNSTTFTYSWSTSGVSAGSYTVTVTGTDLAGNTYAGSDSIKITLDSYCTYSNPN